MADINNLITENIDVWTSAIKKKSATGRGSSKKIELTGIKKLRELILELAVRGKLVPQDSNDEPASVLLEKIAEQKAQLIADKKIKKQKSLPPLDEGDTLSLPNGWETVRFIDVLDFSGGGQPPKSFFSEDKLEGYVQLIQIRDLGPNPQPVYIPRDKASKFCTEEDVMVGRYGASVGKVFWGKDGAYNVALIRIHNDLGSYFNGFIFQLLKSPLGQRLFTGISRSAQDGFNKDDIAPSLLPLPPLAEQHRIVAKVDELMALCDQLEQQTEQSLTAHQTLVETLLGTLTNSINTDDFRANWQRISAHFDVLFTTEPSIDQLKQTILQLAVMGKLVPYGEDVSELLLKDVLEFGPKNGFSAKEVSYETKLKVLKLGATSKGFLDLNESKFIDENISDDSHLWLKEGDILIQRGNSANFVGSSILIKKDYLGYIYPDLMMKIRVNELIDASFLSLVISAQSSRQFLWDKMTGTSGTMPKISKKIVESLPIIFPQNIEIQKNVVSVVNSVIMICDQLKSKLVLTQDIQNTVAEEIVKGVLVQ